MNVITLGEVLLRLSPRQLLSEADGFFACFGGGEENVAAALAGFGIPVRHVTTFPENDLGAAALADLRKCGIDPQFVRTGEGRMGLYFYEAGSSLRAGKVVYDRRGSAFSLSRAEDFPLGEILRDADWLHISGVTPALGGEAKKLTVSAFREAKKRGIRTSFDVNFRPALWTREEAEKTFTQEIMPFVDVCIASSHGTDVLGVENGGTDPERCECAAREIQRKFGCSSVALTVRNSLSASRNELSSLLLTDRVYRSSVYTVEISERMGGGDAFAAGMIYSMLLGLDGERAVEFSAAAEAYKHTVCGDKMCVPAGEIEAFLRGDTRVRR